MVVSKKVYNWGGLTQIRELRNFINIKCSNNAKYLN